MEKVVKSIMSDPPQIIDEISLTKRAISRKSLFLVSIALGIPGAIWFIFVFHITHSALQYKLIFQENQLIILSIIFSIMSIVAFILGLLSLKAVSRIWHEAVEKIFLRALVFSFLTFGIGTLVLLPHYVNSLNLAKQKVTLVSMRFIARAWYTYAYENHTYGIPGKRYDNFIWKNIGEKELMGLLVPNIISEAEAKKNELYRHGHISFIDGWGRPFQFAIIPIADDTIKYFEGFPQMMMKDDIRFGFAIRSAGRDGKWDKELYESQIVTKGYDGDIVYINGCEYQTPEGIAVVGNCP